MQRRHLNCIPSAAEVGGELADPKFRLETLFSGVGHSSKGVPETMIDPDSKLGLWLRCCRERSIPEKIAFPTCAIDGGSDC